MNEKQINAAIHQTLTTLFHIEDGDALEIQYEGEMEITHYKDKTWFKRKFHLTPIDWHGSISWSNSHRARHSIDMWGPINPEA